MKIKRMTEMLILKLLNIGNLDCIQQHLDIIEKRGYVWFGLMGLRPSAVIIDKMFEEGCGYIVLLDSQNQYICKAEDYASKIRPPSVREYPNYYDDKKLHGYRDFSMWFKFTEIIKVTDKNLMDNVVEKRSLEPLLSKAKKNHSSIYYAINKEEIIL